jgi:uncharacterized protein YdhG (YjbR/CyaY superfamily)
LSGNFLRRRREELSEACRNSDPPFDHSSKPPSPESVSSDKREALEALRRIIKAAVPEAEECISYALPAFRLGGKLLVGFGASSNHCSFFPMSESTVETLKDDLKHYSTSKGTIRFRADAQLPEDLVRKVIQTRISENGGRVG